MRRLPLSCAVLLSFVALTASPAWADVKTREKTHVSLGGMLGKMFNLFGGKAAKEGVVSTTAVKGNRKITINDTTGEIVDLSEEKIYKLDMKKKTYEVITFEQLRQQMREAREKAQKQASEQQGKEEKQPEKGQPQKEYEVDFNVKETGQKKQLAGYDTREVIMTVTVREKGKTLEEGGGLVMNVDSWLGPQIPAMKEVAEFELKYWRQLQGPDAMGMSPEQMAMVLAMYPAFKQAADRLQKESPKLQGTPLASTTTVDGVKSKEEAAQQTSESAPKSIGGLGGMLARKMAKKDENASATRGTIFTAEHEVQEIQTSVAASDLEIPAGFKQK
ncbi:MAG TPA: hypothetical protein VL882_26960 [Vicinamibacterales bacterium]|jgi:hypothetical protein|nr:hypothetical protein [Vicinamibacterales bacterium]